MENEFFTTRHSIKPEGEDIESSEFAGISDKGVELAKERGREILADLKKSEKGTIMFIGGVSESPRTKSTTMVYGHEIRNIIQEQGNDDVLVFLSDDLKQIKGYSDKVKFLSEQILKNPDKKIIFDLPLFIKEFSRNNRWTNKGGELTEYAQELLHRNNDNDEESMKDWFENQGKIGSLTGPNPREVAEEHLAGINRLREFAKEYIQTDRPLIIGSVGHGWNLDAMAVYLANHGEVNKEAFEELQAKAIRETKIIRIVEKEGRQVLEYGDTIIPLEK
jgi:hypothetical protein